METQRLIPPPKLRKFRVFLIKDHSMVSKAFWKSRSSNIPGILCNLVCSMISFINLIFWPMYLPLTKPVWSGWISLRVKLWNVDKNRLRTFSTPGHLSEELFNTGLQYIYIDIVISYYLFLFSTRGTNSMPFLVSQRDHFRSTSGIGYGSIWGSFSALHRRHVIAPRRSSNYQHGGRL